jgi:hypothetical protein
LTKVENYRYDFMTLSKRSTYRCRAKGAPMETKKPFLGPKSNSEINESQDLIDLVDLSELSGCPIEAIKKELGLEEDEISMEDLRKKMLALLDSTMEDAP